jgi:transcription elongation factor SPT6
MDQGEVIIRPSSKGDDHLTVTWKVADGICQHIDKEEGKVNAFSLGKLLKINNEDFEDLDEIIARHVNPMASHAREILSFKYYRNTDGGNRDKAKELLKAEKSKQGGKIHYFLSATKEFPGKFMLSYMPRTNARHEYVTVTPDGFRFRKQNFDSLSSLFKWFKEHFRDAIPGTPMTPGGGRLTNRTPYMTGTPGNAVITPGAMSMAAAGTPYGTTPGGSIPVAAMNTPYTPSGHTPFMTPNAMATPRQTPRMHPHSAGRAPYSRNTPSTPGSRRSIPGGRSAMPPPAKY